MQIGEVVRVIAWQTPGLYLNACDFTIGVQLVTQVLVRHLLIHGRHPQGAHRGGGRVHVDASLGGTLQHGVGHGVVSAVEAILDVLCVHGVVPCCGHLVAVGRREAR